MFPGQFIPTFSKAVELDMLEHEEVFQVVLNQGYQLMERLRSGIFLYLVIKWISILFNYFIFLSENREADDAAKLCDEMKSRWRDLQLLLAEKRRSLEIAIKCDNFRSDLLRIDEVKKFSVNLPLFSFPL